MLRELGKKTIGFAAVSPFFRGVHQERLLPFQQSTLAASRQVFQHNIIPRIIATTTHNTSHLTSLKFNPLRAFLPLTSRPSTPVSLFIGIVEEMGTVKHLGTSPHGSFDLKITASTVLHGVNLGYSIAVNDTCLTVTEFDVKVFDFMVGPSPETLRKTSLSKLEPDTTVNRAIIQSSRMDSLSEKMQKGTRMER
ncbi:Riboflavin synthase [Glycine soja]